MNLLVANFANELIENGMLPGELVNHAYNLGRKISASLALTNDIYITAKTLSKKGSHTF